jgi:hypothetical protein
MKNQRNMTTPKETNEAALTDQEEQEIYEMTDKEFRIILLKKFRELQENTDRKLNKIWEIIHEQHEKFDREIKVNHFQIKILEMKNTLTELKHSTTGFNKRLDKAEERISELEDGTFVTKL